LAREKVLALILQTLQELLFLLGPEVVFFLRHAASKAALSRQLLLQQPSRLLGSRQRCDAVAPEVTQHLAWHFFKSLFCELHRIVLKFSERDELNDVRRHCLSVLLRIERFIIGIQDVHRREVRGADTHNDDGQRQA